MQSSGEMIGPRGSSPCHILGNGRQMSELKRSSKESPPVGEKMYHEILENITISGTDSERETSKKARGDRKGMSQEIWGEAERCIAILSDLGTPDSNWT